MPLQNVQPQQDKINKDMRQGSSAVHGPRTGVLPPPAPCFTACSINYSSENFHILRSIQNKSGRRYRLRLRFLPLSSFVHCLALSFHSVRQLLTLPQMTAPKMAGCPFRLVGMGQVREASSTRHRHRRRHLVCCGKFMVANCFAPDRGKQRAGQKRLARGG